VQKFLAVLIHLVLALLVTSPVLATNETEARILFKNANIFDGKNERLLKNRHLLVEGNKIKRIAKTPITVDNNTKVIDAQGRTLMPGMIDVHSHLAIATGMPTLKGDIKADELGIRTAVVAKAFLNDGFTSVRDLGGPTFGVKHTIDEGLVPGPRIFPSGAFITQTSGHGDFRLPADPHPHLGHSNAMQRLGFSAIADGRDQVYTAVRENLRQGATQIKVMAGGGAGSDFDPVDSSQFQPEELEAAVAAAADWNTYVTAHMFTPRSIQRAIKAGVKCVDHGFLIDEETMKMVVKRGVFFAPQMNGMSPLLKEVPGLGPVNIAKIAAVQKDAEPMIRLIKKYKPKVPFAVDALGSPDNQTRQRRYELFYRASLFGNFEALRSATSVSGELLALSGPRNPYKGKLGVIEEGALADILLIDGNPLEDISLVGGSKQWWGAPTDEINTMPLIMKDGQIYKNSL